ncbi:SIS domain-containing protein [Candidatus Njordibacter sp. Uisw_039]|uniref:D-sedoheptulose-7-phosphate isomerase n=1 Tax=Candidatus Njordibacter sp. Uisw_039 TaxID=3230972 RepID=UPI003D4C19CD
MNSLMADQILNQIEVSVKVKQALKKDSQIIAQTEALINLCLLSLQAGGKIIFAGNGGSFADAQHLSAEFTSRFLFDRAPLSSLALGTNNSTISAIGNDYGYDQVFARELESIAKAVDVFIPITTSGNSENILAAANVAKRIGVTTVGLTGKTGGKLLSLCECICIPSVDTASIQECHIMLGHILCGLVESGYFQKEGI